jgi:hypothetical protein
MSMVHRQSVTPRDNWVEGLFCHKVIVEALIHVFTKNTKQRQQHEMDLVEI